MSLYSKGQLDALKYWRRQAWDRPFTLEQIVRVQGAEFYDSPTDTVTSQILSGSWTWPSQERAHITPGGEYTAGDLVLNCDIAHSGALVFSGSRLVVDGYRCAITGVSNYPETGELVVFAKRV